MLEKSKTNYINKRSIKILKVFIYYEKKSIKQKH